MAQGRPRAVRRKARASLRRKWQDAGHLIRPALVFVAGFGLFLGLRAMLVPPSFGRYGHYRAAVLDEIRARPVAFAGQAVCAGCHAEEAAARDAGRHAGLACEACHGPASAHADDPAGVRPAKPEITPLCSGCHEADAAKPKWFKQVVTSEHSGGAGCDGCHSPHNPKM